eukprot:284229_1
MATNFNYNRLYHNKHQFLTALSLLVYSLCYLIFDLYINHRLLQPHNIYTNNLYHASFILICISVFFSIFLPFNHTIKPSKSINVLHILFSTSMIIGGLLYMALTVLQSIPHLQYTESNDHEYAYALLNISAALFICSNAILLGVITLLQCHSSGAIILFTHACILILTSTGMAFFWAAYYNYATISPTQSIFGVIQTGWSIIFSVSLGTLIYEASRSEHVVLLRMFSVLLVIGGFLVFAGSSAFSVNAILVDNEAKHRMEIVIEWSLSFCVFIVCIGCSALFIRSSEPNPQPSVYITKHKKMNYIRSSMDDTFDIKLETTPRREPLWADV